ncbi:hypothetical protein MBLNU13_g06422t1 [Cladosporium sp. NU13]
MDSPQQALDALQREINLILEQTGRLFAAANQPTPEAALARASRLKQQLPVSNNRFHQALDVLDEKLQFAKVVIRRDLAVARSSNSGAEVATKVVEVPQAATTEPAAPESDAIQQSDTGADIIDITEPDAPQPETTKEAEEPPATSPKKRPSPSHEDGSVEEPATKKQAVGDEIPTTSEPQTSNMKLELNTNATEQASGEQSADDKAPDTATFSNTGDLDSLFNDTTSAGGTGGDEPDFSTSADLNAEFDFTSFNDATNSNDNDNISALLPGLQDYANETTGNEPDFSSFFTADPPNNLTDQSQNNNTAMGQQLIDTAQGDSTFDDIFDMTFDMGGGTDGNQNGGAQFDFDFS